jgi:hypothetical protein
MESYSLTNDIEVLDAKLEMIKVDGEITKNRLTSLEKVKELALEENLTDIVEDIEKRVGETKSLYELLKDNYRLVRERRDSLPV